MNPFLKQKGGKFYTRKYLYPYFPTHIQDYVEPFLGGGSVFWNLKHAKIYVKGNCYLNDKDKDIFTCWNVMWDKTKFIQLMAMMSNFALYSKDVFDYLLKYQPQNEIEHAFKTLMLTMMSLHGDCKTYYIGIGDVGRRNYKIYEPQSYWEKYLRYLRDYNVKLSNCDFRDIIKPALSRKTTFVYSDPPYWGTSGYDTLPFTEKDHQDLAEYWKNFNGQFLQTLNDRPETRSLYKDFYIIPFSTRWTMNSKSTLNTKNGAKEIIITNYTIKNSID